MRAHPRIYAHRGASKALPENTQLAFEEALAVGADALETDIHLTRDGRIVIFHDDDGARMAGVQRPIAECTLAEVKTWNIAWGYTDASGQRPYLDRPQRILTLDDLLDAFPKTIVNLDMKTDDPAMPKRLCEVLSRRTDPERVQVGSFHDRLIWRLGRLGFTGVRALTKMEAIAALGLPHRFARRVFGARRRVQIPTHYNKIALETPKMLRRWKRLGLAVDIYTINDPRHARYLAGLGVDGIMTDDPETIADALRG